MSSLTLNQIGSLPIVPIVPYTELVATRYILTVLVRAGKIDLVRTLVESAIIEHKNRI